MPGDDVRRFCEGCREHVHDLSAMDPSAAQRFVADHPRACLRFAIDGRGRVVFRSRRLAVVATVAALAGCAGWDEAAEPTPPSDDVWTREEPATEIPDVIDNRTELERAQAERTEALRRKLRKARKRRPDPVVITMGVYDD